LKGKYNTQNTLGGKTIKVRCTFLLKNNAAEVFITNHLREYSFADPRGQRRDI
jgi:hypothetical protein